jgi:hypothetical protein
MRVRALMSLPMMASAWCLVLLAHQLVGARPVQASEISYEFRPQPRGARAWLASQGFEFRMAMGDPSLARIDLGERGLTIETLGPSEPVIARSNINVPQPARLTITWGVNRYPVGANWDTGANNEAIMVMVFFGTEKLPGGFFVPPSPHFIGFFLCERGRRGAMISGRSYTRQGRYICLDGPPAGAEITSTVALDKAFGAAFGAMRVPAVSGFAIEADTTQVGAGGRSSAWVRSIRIATAN